EWKDSDFGNEWIRHLLLSSSLRRKNAEQRNDEIHAQERLQIVVRLTAASGRYGEAGERRIRCLRIVQRRAAERLSKQVIARRSLIRSAGSGQERMRVSRNLADRKRHRLHSAGLRQSEAVTEVDWHPSAQVWQCERRLPVAAVGRADQIEQCFVFGNRKQLAVAKHPAGGCEIPRKHADFADIGLCHGNGLRQVWLGKMPCSAMLKFSTR